ncbi:hypothetical protein DRP04_05250 [Archaeoglobales archaeon]|nr:MAG: hypothetical protein DRP04_05250 [Archaeoglobales archaeon]
MVAIPPPRDYYTRSQIVNRRLQEKKKRLFVVIYGSYAPHIKPHLIEIRDFLRGKGYEKTFLVEDLPNIDINGFEADMEQKSIYYLEASDVNLLFFFKHTDNQSVAREAHYVLDNPHLIGKSIFFDEKEPEDEYSGILTLLRDRLERKRITAIPFSRENMLSVVLKSLNDFTW